MVVVVILIVVIILAAAGAFWYYRTSLQTSIILTGLSPTNGGVGTQVTITGSGFVAAGNTIYFGGGNIATDVSSDGTHLAFQVPSAVSPCYAVGSDLIPGGACSADALIISSGSYPVWVSNAGGVSNVLNFVIGGVAKK